MEENRRKKVRQGNMNYCDDISAYLSEERDPLLITNRLIDKISRSFSEIEKILIPIEDVLEDNFIKATEELTDNNILEKQLDDIVENTIKLKKIYPVSEGSYSGRRNIEVANMIIELITTRIQSVIMSTRLWNSYRKDHISTIDIRKNLDKILEEIISNINFMLEYARQDKNLTVPNNIINAEGNKL